MYHGQFELDKFLHLNYFKDVKNGFFIECGAFDGLIESTCLFFASKMGWKGINIEPVPSNYDLLVKHRPNEYCINCALSNKYGKATFNHAVHPQMGERFGNGSLTHTKQHHDSLKRDGCTFQTFEVTTLTYRDVVALHASAYGLEKIDLFVLDVEGHELQAIEGMAGSSFLPRVFCVEHGHLGVEVLKKVLEPMGYKFDKIHVNNSIFILDHPTN